MAYSDFTIADLRARFGLRIDESRNLFADAPEADLPPVLSDMLARYMPLVINVNTEKARSELVIAPVLVEFKLLHRDRVSLFSGIDFTVDEAAGLKGRCDYILSRSPEQLALTSPVCVLVEAKNENIVGGIPQCLAEMVAARRFNERAGLRRRHDRRPLAVPEARRRAGASGRSGIPDPIPEKDLRHPDCGGGRQPVIYSLWRAADGDTGDPGVRFRHGTGQFPAGDRRAK